MFQGKTWLLRRMAFYNYVSQFHQKIHKDWTCHTERSCHNIGLTYTKYSVNDSRRLVCEGERVILSRKSEQSDPVDALWALCIFRPPLVFLSAALLVISWKCARRSFTTSELSEPTLDLNGWNPWCFSSILSLFQASGTSGTAVVTLFSQKLANFYYCSTPQYLF